MRSTKLNDVQKKQRDEIKMTNTMSLIIGSFLVCWTPFVVYIFLVAMTEDRSIFLDSGYGQLLRIFAMCLAHFNPVIDPLIYACRMKEVRDGIKRIFTCSHQSNTKQPQSSTTASSNLS